MKRALLLALLLAASGACKSKTTTSHQAAAAAAKLTDLSKSLDAARTAFNEKKKEARFIALLSPS